MPVKLLEQAFKAIEYGVESGLVVRKVGTYKPFKLDSTAIVVAPELRDLVQAASQASAANYVGVALKAHDA
jgi:hypothetical protein